RSSYGGGHYPADPAPCSSVQTVAPWAVVRSDCQGYGDASLGIVSRDVCPASSWLVRTGSGAKRQRPNVAGDPASTWMVVEPCRVIARPAAAAPGEIRRQLPCAVTLVAPSANTGAAPPLWETGLPALLSKLIPRARTRTLSTTFSTCGSSSRSSSSSAAGEPCASTAAK